MLSESLRYKSRRVHPSALPQGWASMAPTVGAHLRGELACCASRQPSCSGKMSELPTSGPHMPRNIVIFADGTGQVGGVRPDQRLSNIYKLYRATRVGPDSPIDPRGQVAYYDPGLGTTSASGHVRVSLWERLKATAGLAVGVGFRDNVVDCYEAILQRYEPGDRIYLFGFSRGGYTIRALANVLNLCGVPTTDTGGAALPRKGNRLRAIAREAVRVYEHGAGSPRAKFQGQKEALAKRFRHTYGSGVHPKRGDVFPYFIGAFDSVAALGLSLRARVMSCVAGVAVMGLVGWGAGSFAERFWGWSSLATGWSLLIIGVLIPAGLFAKSTFHWTPPEFRKGERPWNFAFWQSKHYDQFLDPRVPVVRHALAIDETRKQFGRVGWGGSNNVPQPGDERLRFEQRWFAGNHSDIGGSYPEDESRLSDIVLEWMAGEATAGEYPLIVDWTKLHLHPDPFSEQHSEIFSQQQKPWWKRPVKWPTAPRKIDNEAILDESVYRRFTANVVDDCDQRRPYRPESLRSHWAVSRVYDDASDNKDSSQARTIIARNP